MVKVVGEEASSSNSAGSALDGVDGGSVLDKDSRHEQLSFIDNMRYVRDHYKPLGAQISELARLSFGAGKISPDEYYEARLYDDHLDFAEKCLFAGDKKRLQIWNIGNYNTNFHGILWNKAIFYLLMRGASISVPETIAVYCPGRFMGGYRTLRRHDDVRHFLREESTPFPLFTKPSESLQSINIASIESYDSASDELILRGDRRVSLSSFMDEVDAGISDQGIGGDNCYLFQKHLYAHSDLRSMIGDLPASARIVTFNNSSGARIFRAIWKLPIGGNVADNFWRGNLLASIDIESGKITRVIRGTGLRMEELRDHPQTGHRLQGVILPGWEELRDICLRAADILPELPAIGWDVVWSDEGAVILEGNLSPDVWLLQFASGKGILGKEMDDLLSYSSSRLKNLRAYIKKVSQNYHHGVRTRSIPKIHEEIAHSREKTELREKD